MNSTNAFPLLSAVVAVAIALPAAAQPGGAGTQRSAARPAVPAATAAAPTAAPTAAPAAAPSTTQVADYIVAIVQREPVTNSEVRARVAMLQREFEARKQPAPPLAELRSQALQQLIMQSALAQRAGDLGLKVDDATLERTLADMAQENHLTPAQFKAHVQSRGVDYAALQRDVRRQLLAAQLRERTLDPTIKVTDADVDAWLAQNRAERQRAQATGASGVLLDIAQILVAVPENASAAEVAQLQARARDIRAKVDAPGADFAALAHQYSNAVDVQRTGGDFGLLPAERYPDLFVNSVAKLQPGQTTGPIRSGAGFHILKLVAREQAPANAGEATETHVRHILLRVTPQLTQQAAIAQLAADRQRITAGQADFATLAREQSQDASANNGGDLGWAPPGAFVPEFEQAMDALAPGQISQPVVTRFGVHLIEVLARRQTKLDAQHEREAARRAVREYKLEQAYDDWARDIRAQAYVELRQPPQ